MSDPGSTYRTRDEITGIRQERDPVERLRRYLDQKGQWTQTFQDVVEAEFMSAFERVLSSRQEESA